MADVIKNSTRDKGVTFINETKENYISYEDMYKTSGRISCYFRDKGIFKGSKAILQFNCNELFIYTFWACILGGIIPILAPNQAIYKYKDMLNKIILQFDDVYIIADNEAMKSIKSNMSVEQNRLINVNNDTLSISPLNHENVKVDSQDIAFIQFSSGSTSRTKGALITHSNIISNTVSIYKRLQIGQEDASLCWLPLTYNLGLIGFHIIPLMVRGNQYLMDSKMFYINPMSWMIEGSNLSLFSKLWI